MLGTAPWAAGSVGTHRRAVSLKRPLTPAAPLETGEFGDATCPRHELRDAARVLGPRGSELLLGGREVANVL